MSGRPWQLVVLHGDFSMVPSPVAPPGGSLPDGSQPFLLKILRKVLWACKPVSFCWLILSPDELKPLTSLWVGRVLVLFNLNLEF